jgi:hypothetical protein
MIFMVDEYGCRIGTRKRKEKKDQDAGRGNT